MAYKCHYFILFSNFRDNLSDPLSVSVSESIKSPQKKIIPSLSSLMIAKTSNRD